MVLARDWSATAPTGRCWVSSISPGAFQQFFTSAGAQSPLSPRRNPYQRAVFTEPLAAACEILDQVSIPAGERVAVLGDGKLGLLIAMVLNARQAIVSSSSDAIRTNCESPRPWESRWKSAGDRLPSAEFDWVVDATGSAEGLRRRPPWCGPRGTVILKSTVHGMVPVDTAPIIVNEITLVGSRCGRFEAALPLLEHPGIRVEDMVAARYPLRDAPAAFARAAERGR